MIAAPKSGSGKTLITCALLMALKERGYRLRAFKTGPDYIDPMFHKKIIGIPSKNLDLFFLNENEINKLVSIDDEYDISVIEGVMGLYDGIGGISNEASSYHLAEALNTPIILVIDAKGMGGGSILAELSGFLAYDEKKLIKGVILNRISEHFFKLLKPLIEEKLDISALGYFPESKDISIESRHLGLKLPYEYENLTNMTKKAASLLKQSLDIEALLKIAGLDIKAIEGPLKKDFSEDIDESTKEGKLKIAVAMDEAFCFYYEDNLRLFREAGVRLCYFSPIRDKSLPKDICGLLLGGGYPENYLKELEANKEMLKAIKDSIKKGMPSIAECGGFMYLHEGIYDKSDNLYEMAGLLRGNCSYKNKLVRFGYIEVDAINTDFCKDELHIKGHEFHYYDSESNGKDCIARKPSSGRKYECMHMGEKNIWGFPHLYYPSCPKLVDEFIKKCEQFAILSEAEHMAR